MNALLVSNAMLNDPKSRDRYTMICTGSKTKRKRSYYFKDEFDLDTSREGLRAMMAERNSLAQPYL
ncbi:uncharacterized protein N7525_003875 [Penicillium rubens]|uniref:uncharacterized protein n=1 Tax=Penicillium rubens TaxID=1108849 RepID=UPI002A5AD490|nr:uncharacterized protein N7525_003875 [Penicillium rubens]KAJ5838687.1 hypothetical protein N7525_003875 [Penicillium rubens]KAJ5866738.1 hypothetical protein N7534_001291 [Penicillium rubens]